MSRVMWAIDWLFLCKLKKTHPVPDGEQLISLLCDGKPITCKTCGKEYSYR